LLPLTEPTPHADAVASHAGLLALLEQAARAACWTWVPEQAGPGPHPGLQHTRALARLLQWPPDATPPWREPMEFLAPECRAVCSQALAALRPGRHADLETTAITASGQRLQARLLMQCGESQRGRIVQGVLQDIGPQKALERTSQRLTAQLSSTLASMTEAFATLDRQGRFSYVNAQTCALLARSSAQLLGRHIWLELDDQGSDRLRREVLQAVERARGSEFEEFYLPLRKWLELRLFPFEDGLAVYFHDVSERRRQQEELLLLKTSISRLNDVVVIAETTQADGPRIVFANDAFTRLTGYALEEVLGRNPRMLEGPQTQPGELERIRQALRRWEPARAELINHKKNGELFWLELEVVPVDESPPGVRHWVAVGRDITARKAQDEAIEHLAFYDTLTQLPNRRLLMERLRKALSAPGSRQRYGALMFIDLDHFKVLNDTLGHARGDMLLQQVAQRLSSCVRRRDTVARLGGDEFVVMLEDLAPDPGLALSKTQVVGRKILSTLSEPYDLAGHQFHGTCSVGITPFHNDHETIGELLKQADLAMYQAKAAGRNSLCFFDPAMQAAATANAALISELRQALHEQRFLLHYQPQVGRKERMVGVEALVRWQRGQTLTAPGEFITQAEESGLIMPLGAWVLETACAQIAAWAGRPDTEHLVVAVNVSARQFRHPEFVDLVMATIGRTGIRPDRLKLELTESLLATDIAVTIAKMGRLKELGVTLSIDDFGMGYSALSYLKHMPLDQLKIDRAFVKDVLTDPNDAAIARTIIGLAQSLGLAVVAEGVETEAQRDFLARHGCEYYQGYLFSPPLGIEALESFMRERGV
jgi:diguanylate cyclase (GGDEF)-like protein/PAS domain S-box-containing protein